VYFLLT
jgi:hypothetical protein